MSNSKHILFIGANNMAEISGYVNTYQHGLFIEAIPDIFKQLSVNLQHANLQYNTNYIPINCLVSDVPNKEYTFNIFSNNGASSSIYEPNLSEWKWPDVKKIDTIQLTSTTIDNILKEYNWENITYDVLLDVQGAELDVLKGISDDNFKNIQTIKTEISTKAFYVNGVIFEELHNYIISKGFKLSVPPNSDHDDAIYTRM